MYTQLSYLNVAHRYLCAAQESGLEVDKEKEKIYLLLVNNSQAQRYYLMQQNDEDTKELCHQYTQWISASGAHSVAWNDIK